MYNPKTGIRAQHRLQEGQRVKESPTLEEKFPQLKSLKVTLSFFDGGIASRSTELKYTVNVAHAKSVFRFGCANGECVRGDFDLSEELARAVAGRLRKATGEVRCEGWRSKESIDAVRCHKLLRFQLDMAYHAARRSLAATPAVAAKVEA